MSRLIPLMAHVMEGMRYYFDTDGSGKPVGGFTGPVQHRGGLLIPLDGFPESPSDDDCATQAFVNVLRQWRTTSFPTEVGEVTPCGGSRAVLIQMGVARCSMAMDDDGNPPPPARLEHEALALLDDADRLYAAACRATKNADDEDLIQGSVIHAWEPVGPQGGILTGLLTVSYELAT